MTTDLPRPVLARHDDGRWYQGQLLHTYRDGRRWRGVVRHFAGVGSQYQRGRDQAAVRLVDEEE